MDMISPAEHIIGKLGGLTKTARMLSSEGKPFAISTVQGWKERGKIPQEYWLPIIEAAKAEGIEVSLEMFLAVPAPEVAE